MIITTSAMFIVILSMTLIDDCRAIVNGDLSSLGELKYMVSLYDHQSGRGHICGGSIFNEHWVITAGHCAFNEEPDNFWIIAGVIYLPDRINRRVYPVAYFVLQDDYKPEVSIRTRQGIDRVIKDPVGDIALVRIEKSFHWEPFLQPLKNLAPADSELPIGAECQVYGWGAEDPEDWDVTSDYLNKMKINIIDQKLCPGEDYDVTDTNFCVKDFTEKATPCNGDSGGPLICNGIIYGVASVSQCDPVGASLYTTVSKFRKWIQETIEVCEEEEKTDELLGIWI